MIGRRKGSATLTKLEIQIMQVLWEHGAGTVVQVQELLKPVKELAYTTVQTVLNKLELKQQVRRSLAGRAYCYEAVTSKESILKLAIRELAEHMFRGSPEDLVMSLVKSRQVDPLRIADLSRRIAEEDSSDA